MGSPLCVACGDDVGRSESCGCDVSLEHHQTCHERLLYDENGDLKVMPVA